LLRREYSLRLFNIPDAFLNFPDAFLNLSDARRTHRELIGAQTSSVANIPYVFSIFPTRFSTLPMRFSTFPTRFSTFPTRLLTFPTHVELIANSLELRLAQSRIFPTSSQYSLRVSQTSRRQLRSTLRILIPLLDAPSHVNGYV